MRLFKINTTVDEEEDFLLLTDLSEQQIYDVLHPVVTSYRESDEEYDNESLVKELKKKYPNNPINMIDDFSELSV